MSRILLTTIGSLGDLHPKIAVALELRRRGHDVVFATHKEYQDKIESLGFEFHRMRPDNTALNDPEEMARMMDLKTGTEYVIRNWVCANLRETYADLKDAAKNADLIINGEGVLAARLVAEKLEIPWVLTVLQPLAFLSAHDPSVLPVLPSIFQLPGLKFVAQRGIRQLSKILSKSWAAPIHQLREEINLPPLKGNPFIDDKYSPYLVLAMFSSILAKPQPDDIIAVNYVPYSQIFSRSCAIVHQGGIGTTAQALRAGRPTLVMPYSHDQPDNAARVERLGISRTISRKQYTVKRVSQQLHELLENPSYTAKAAEIGEIIRAEYGVKIACNALEKQLQLGRY